MLTSFSRVKTANEDTPLNNDSNNSVILNWIAAASEALMKKVMVMINYKDNSNDSCRFLVSIYVYLMF